MAQLPFLLFAAPYLTLSDPDSAVRELAWALERDARLVCMVAGPVWTAQGRRSPADPLFDPFWARVDEAGITVAYHGGDYGYDEYVAAWGEPDEFESFKASPLKAVMLGNRAPYDHMAALVCHGLFRRFPNLRVASIEMGSNWVPWLFQTFRRVYGQTPKAFAENPIDTFRRHIWVAPFHEDDVGLLRDLLGSERMLLGSDYPHAEGLADPASYVRELEGFSDAEIRRVMRDNALGLAQRRPASAA